MLINNQFDIADTVYLKTDMEQLPRIVYAIQVTINGLIYFISSGTDTSEHYEFELSTEENIVRKLVD